MKDETVQQLTVSGKSVKAPAQKIPNAKAAFAIYQRLKDDNRSTAKRNAQLTGMYNGNSPWDQEDRKRRGMSWFPNVNPREAEAIIDLNVSSKWDMFNSAPRFLEMAPAEYTADPSMRVYDWGRVISEQFTKVLKSWDDFNWNVMLRLGEMDKYGCGPVIWPDEVTWKSEAIKNSNILMPKKTRSSIGKVQYAFIYHDMDPIEILNAIDSDVAGEEGWNKEYAKKALTKWYKGEKKDTSYRTDEWDRIQQEIRNRDYSPDDQFDLFPVIMVLAEESSGKVTHGILWADGEHDPEWIFEKPERFESMGRALHLMLFNIGDGYIYSVRGLLSRIYATCDLSARMFNIMVGGAMMSSGLLLKMLTGGATEKLSITHTGLMTVIPAEVEPVQQTFQPPLDNVIQVREVIQTLQNNNTGIYRRENENVKQPRTLGEAQLQVANEARYESNQASWYYVQWEAWLKETLRRMMNKSYDKDADGYEEQQSFMKACKDAGVPDQFMDFDMWEVKAYRTIGYGSPAMRMQAVDKMMKAIGLYDERGRTEILREWTAALVQWCNVDRFVTMITRDTLPSVHHQMAEGENADMAQGVQRSVGSDDADKIHVDVHFKWMGEIAQAFIQNPQSAAQTAPALRLGIVHSTAHLKQLSIDPSRKGQVKQYAKILANFAKLLNKMIAVAGQIQKAQQARAQAGQEQVRKMQEELQSREADVKKYEIDRMFELKKYEADLLNSAREDKTETSTKVSMKKAAAEIARQDAIAEADIAREDRKEQSERESETVA